MYRFGFWVPESRSYDGVLIANGQDRAAIGVSASARAALGAAGHRAAGLRGPMPATGLPGPPDQYRPAREAPAPPCTGRDGAGRSLRTAPASRIPAAATPYAGRRRLCPQPRGTRHPNCGSSTPTAIWCCATTSAPTQGDSRRPEIPAEDLADRLRHCAAALRSQTGRPKENPMARPGYRLALIATALAVVVVLLGASRLTRRPRLPGLARLLRFPAVPMSEHKQNLAALRFPDAAGGAQGLERDGPSLFRRRPRAGDPRPCRTGDTPSRPTRATAEVAAAAARGGHRPGDLRHVDGDPAALAAGRHRAPARGSPRSACCFCCACGCPARLLPCRPWTVVCADSPASPCSRWWRRSPGRLGQQQLCGGGLHRFPHLPRRMVAADGLRQRLQPDPPRHRPQLPRRPALRRGAHGDPSQPPHRCAAGDAAVAALAAMLARGLGRLAWRCGPSHQRAGGGRRRCCCWCWYWSITGCASCTCHPANRACIDFEHDARSAPHDHKENPMATYSANAAPRPAGATTWS